MTRSPNGLTKAFYPTGVEITRKRHGSILSSEKRKDLGGRPTKIEQLTPELQTEIDTKLFREGWSAPKLVMWLKDDKNIHDIGVSAVGTYVKRMNGPLKALRGNFYLAATAGVAEKIDALVELYKCAQLQTKRMSPLLEIETNEKKLIPGVDRAIDLFRRTCVDILTVEMDLGVRKRVSSVDSLTKKELSDDELKTFMKNLLPPKKKQGETQTASTE
jgi:hypothetical protein